MKKETYRDLYLKLPKKAQRAIRDLMKVTGESDRRHPVIGGTYCTSRFDDAVARINRATRETIRENARPEECEFTNEPYTYYEKGIVNPSTISN